MSIKNKPDVKSKTTKPKKPAVKKNTTQCKRTDEALHESEAKFHSIIDLSPVPCALNDEEQNITYLNAAFIRTFGYDLKDIPTLADWWPKAYPDPDYRHWVAETWQAHLDKAKTERTEFEPMELNIQCKDGSIRTALAGAGALGDAFKGVHLVTLYDITGRKQAEDALRIAEADHRAIFENAPVGIFRSTVNGRFIKINRAMAEIYGYSSPDEMMVDIKSIADQIYAEPIYRNEFSRLIAKDGEVSNFESLDTRRDGGTFWTSMNARGVKNDAGKVLYYEGFVVDITQRKLAETELLEKEVQYRNLADSGLALIWTSGTDKLCNYFNEPWLKFTGRTMQQEMGNGWAEGVHPDDFDRCLQTYVAAFDRREAFDMEYRLRHVSGEYRWLQDLGTPNYNSAREFVGYIGHCFDITERKLTEEKIRELNATLEQRVKERTQELRDVQEKIVRQEKLAVLGQMAGSVGHELRNPLGVISNAIYFLKMVQPDASDKVKEYLNLIEKNIYISDKIVEDLLDFTRVKSAAREPLSVPDLVRQTLERFPAPESVKVELDLPADLPQAYADPQHLTQVLGNLTLNACQAMVSGTPKSNKLVISSRAQGDMIYIAVQDTGAGISSENMKKLFEPLFTTKPKGIGLGLAVSKKLIEANGGRIEVQTEVDKGSTFSVYLPIYK